MEIKNLPLSLVKPSPMNPRKTFDQEGLEELASNIEKQGLLQPITVRPTTKKEYSVVEGVGDFHTTYEIVCGERRYRAMCILSDKWKDMDSVAPKGETYDRFNQISAIVKDMSDAEAFDAMITENLQRKDVDPIEEAFAFGQLIDRGDTAEEVALRFGKSIRFVQDRIKLNSLIPELMLAIRDGKMPISAGMLISKLDDEQQRDFYKKYGTSDRSEDLSKWNAERYVNNLFMELYNSPWIKAGEPGFEGSCGTRCAQCSLNTANHGCLFYEMKGDNRGKCTNREKYEAKINDYALHVVDTYANQLVKSGEGLVKGKMVVGININTWDNENGKKPKYAMEEAVRAKGFEVVNPAEYFQSKVYYDVEDERVAEKLVSGECYIVLNLYGSYGDHINIEKTAYNIKKDDKETNKNELGIPNEVQKYMSEYQSTQNISASLVIEGAKAIGKATPTIKALTKTEKVALAVMMVRECGTGTSREKIGISMNDTTADVQKSIEERIDTIFPCILKYWMQQKIALLSNSILYEVEKYLPELGPLWCEEEFKASQDAVITKRDKKLKSLDKKLSDLGYSPSGKKLIKPSTPTHEDLKKQYEEMKKKHPDAILLFRVNEFYEIFGEDAVSASKALNLTLTKRADGTELCGFPHHALDTYLPKLVRAGLRAAICEQLEDPKK